jgi:hypothetical protein
MPRFVLFCAFAVLAMCQVPLAHALPVDPSAINVDELAAPAPSPAATPPTSQGDVAPVEVSHPSDGPPVHAAVLIVSGPAGLGILALGLYGAALRRRRERLS